jgi:Kef-type K+ transport system membrane component KefB
VIPHDSVLARDIRVQCEDLVVVLLLPVLFVFTGMRTQIGLLHGTRDWVACILIIGVGSIGKFGGSFFTARSTGSYWREAASLGVLMNTRGLIELIVLNVGLNLGVLLPAPFILTKALASTVPDSAPSSSTTKSTLRLVAEEFEPCYSVPHRQRIAF